MRDPGQLYPRAGDRREWLADLLDEVRYALRQLLAEHESQR
jgi:hypothetical protein